MKTEESIVCRSYLLSVVAMSILDSASLLLVFLLYLERWLKETKLDLCASDLGCFSFPDGQPASRRHRARPAPAAAPALAPLRSCSYRGMRFYCKHFVVAAFWDFLRTHQFPRLVDWFIHERPSSSRRKCLFSAASSLKFVMKLIRKQCVIYFWIRMYLLCSRSILII